MPTSPLNRPVPTLLSNERLEQSSVVANCRMNRERTLTGGNGYTRELGFNPVQFLQEQIQSAGHASWLDLCCGTGNALIEAARLFHDQSQREIKIVGIDLAGMFSKPASVFESLQLIEASLTDWQSDQQFDLITCVHGLHYIGDKLDLITRAVSWLTPQGTFAANLSMENIQLNDGRSTRIVAAALRKNGIDYDIRRKRVTCRALATIQLPFQYLGADDNPGPNYTGQPAINSYYERIR